MTEPIFQYLIGERFSDERGTLVTLGREHSFLDFQFCRSFILTDLPVDTVRGKHAHKSTSQLIQVVSGAVDVYVENSFESKLLRLDAPNAILVPPRTWLELKILEAQTVISVLANHVYDPDEYIYAKEDLNE